MTEGHLISKKQFYEAKKLEILEMSYDAEISEKVEAFRKEKEQEILEFETNLRANIESQKVDDVAKIDHYLELLNLLISETKLINDVQEDVQENVQENQSQEEQLTQTDTIVRPIMSL